MTALGISWGWIAAAGAVAGTVLAALAFLRPRHRERVIPSIMLWLSAAGDSPRRVLWQKFSRPLSLLAAGLSVFFMLLSLAEPVLELPAAAKPKRQVVVASPGAFGEARKFAARLDPLRTALVRAESGGEVVNDLGSPARLSTNANGSGLAPDWQEISALATALAGPDGAIHVFCASPPPQLPENAMFHRVGAEEKSTSAAPLSILPVGGSAEKREELSCLPGTVVASDAAGADLVCDASWDLNELEKRLYASETYMAASSGQELETSSVPPELPRRRSLLLGTGLAILALIAAAADFLLWQRGKIV